MDPLWYALSDEERAWLDARPIGPAPGASLPSFVQLLQATSLRWPAPGALTEQPGLVA